MRLICIKMAPVPAEHPTSYIPLALTVIHLILIIYLGYAVGASLYTSYKSLSPSQDTRERRSRRIRLVSVFLGLALTALVVATYSSVSYATLSYKVWADERGVDLPERLIGEKGLFPDTKNSSQLHLARWLSDTPIYYDALEIIAEKARRFWWGQQIDLALVSWSSLLAIEGRRRRIPLLWAFIALAHLVNLSFAQNLFYLAMILTPSPIPPQNERLELPVLPIPTSRFARIRDAVIPQKPKNWRPHSAIFLGTLIANFSAIFVLPYAAETPSFGNVVLLARAATFLPLLLPKVVPVSLGAIHTHLHNGYSSYTTLFRTISVVSFALYIKASFLGLSYNTPDSHYHRHSRFIPWDVEERSTWERSTTALGRVLGSTADHPVVAQVAWDVILCTLSLGLWAAVRATNVRDIIRSCVPFYDSNSNHTTLDMAENSSRVSTKTYSEATDSPEREPPTTVRRRGRPKTRIASVASIGSVASSTGANEGLVSPSPRKRGRPRKKQPEEERVYEPTPDEARDVVEVDILPPDEWDWESAALAWGLAALGGLGSACAGVFGGECISR